jgi:serine/threonine protein phosphatase PrpC
MATEIIVALIGLGGSAIGSIIGIVASSKLTAYRIEQLEKKVEKHNTIVDRTYEVEKNIEVIKEEIKVANHRIEDLEKG